MNDSEIQEIINQLSVLEPTPLDTPRPAAQALNQVQQRIQAAEKKRPSSFWQ
jgi:hypothetical protein